MATKNCPKCSSQVPVACKKCSCGHSFFNTRKGSGTSGSGQSSSSGASTSKQETVPPPEPPVVLRDRIPRERGRPVFYDAQELDAQMKKQKLLLKKQSKSQSSKSESSKVPGSKVSSTENDNAPTTEEEEPSGHISESGADDQNEPAKRKRGRPPGIGGKKGRLSNPRNPIAINSSSRILPNRRSTSNANATNNNSLNVNNNNVDVKSISDEAEDIMSDLSPEKALQLNIVLNEINPQ